LPRRSRAACRRPTRTATGGFVTRPSTGWSGTASRPRRSPRCGNWATRPWPRT
jgi:hypothetical protein